MQILNLNFSLLINLFYFFISIESVTLSPENRKLYHDLIAGRGLYNNDERIVVLNVTNFKSQVFETKNAWIVEFYNSWCGYCHRFAPVWRALANDLYSWRNVITIAAVDCANEDNNPLCREYEVMYYPMLKFFPSNSKIGQMGIEINKGKNIDEIRHLIVETLLKEHVNGRGIGWPNISPYRNSELSNLWKNVPEKIKFIILILEETESHIGTEVILDLHSVEEIQIRCVLNHNEAISRQLSVNIFPSLVVLEKDLKSIKHLRASENSRKHFRIAIKEFLNENGISVPKEEELIDPGEWKKLQPPDIVQLMAAEKQEKELLQIKELGDVVFQTDLDLALIYALSHEISSHKHINGEAYQALDNFLIVMAKYFPTSSKGRMFLEKLSDSISHNTKNEITGEYFLDYYRKLESEYGNVFAVSKEWLGCRGSDPTYRGYPCGLWTMFHTLTVNAVLKDGSKSDFNSREVLEAMLGYITYFFGCQDCSKHFQAMAAETNFEEVQNPDDGIIWLWRAHNRVNKRLAKDSTEDPQFPKIQFPSEENCPTCKNSNDQWIIKEVLMHLKKMYMRRNINYMGLDTKPLDEKKQSENIEEIPLVNMERLRSSWNFNIFDISLCVVLYGCSCTILILVCIKFAIKRKYKKKQYIHDMFSKA